MHEKTFQATVAVVLLGLVVAVAVEHKRIDDVRRDAKGALNLARSAGTTMPGAMRRPPNSWPKLGQEKVIAIGETLKAKDPTHVAILCADAGCQELQADLDDAFQLADWPTDWVSNFIPGDGSGIAIGPAGTAAESLRAALAAAGLRVRIDGDLKADNGVMILIGKR